MASWRGYKYTTNIWTTDWLHMDPSIPKCALPMWADILKLRYYGSPSCELAYVLRNKVSFHTSYISITVDFSTYEVFKLFPHSSQKKPWQQIYHIPSSSFLPQGRRAPHHTRLKFRKDSVQYLLQMFSGFCP